MTRGEIWLAQMGKKRRPVLILTRPEVIDVRQLVTVAEVTSSMRGLAAEVVLDHADVGLERPSAVNCDGLHTISQSVLTHHVGDVDERTMGQVCRAVAYAVGC
ncbi:MAG: growth inhibitor [Ilumatobacteraceae bacterium]|nr:growth inhibitor [Ilumatobacteraceae bacterium]